MIRTTCSCGKKLKTDDKHQGKTIKCPQCGKSVTMPYSLDDIPSLPPDNPYTRGRDQRRPGS